MPEARPEPEEYGIEMQERETPTKKSNLKSPGRQKTKGLAARIRLLDFSELDVTLEVSVSARRILAILILVTS